MGVSVMSEFSHKSLPHVEIGDLVIIDLMIDDLMPEDKELATYDMTEVVGYIKCFMYDDDDPADVWASIHVLDKSVPYEYDTYHRFLSSDPETVDRPMSEFNATWWPKK